MANFLITELIEKAAENVGYIVKRSLSSTSFGKSDYLYIANDFESCLDGIAVKVRISDHGVTNIDRIFNEIHVECSSGAECVEGIIDSINFKLNRSEYFTPKESFELFQSYNVQTRQLREDDVVTDKFTTKKGETLYVVTRTYRMPVTFWINNRTGEVFSTVKK